MRQIGLSPLARGTQGYTPKIESDWRFIPAGAGNSHQRNATCQASPVYPRWRGELTSEECNLSGQPGLSPLARGTPNHKFSQKPGQRFIPAGAGNSILAFQLVRRDAVYPRWRGELLICVSLCYNKYGLSPLARGTLLLLGREIPADRFIPAGAGNSIGRG